MDASQYKDYVLFMLFIKYVTDKYGDSTDFAPPVTIPKGSSFTDMLALRGKSDIGDKICVYIGEKALLLVCVLGGLIQRHEPSVQGTGRSRGRWTATRYRRTPRSRESSDRPRDRGLNTVD